MTRSQAETIGALGAFVFAIAIRMAGAAGERKEQAEELLAHRALHDPLTGLPNRQLLVDRLTHAIAMAHRRGGMPPVVMFLDLDRFKLVNDTFGHRAGDELLVQVADRLRGRSAHDRHVVALRRRRVRRAVRRLLDRRVGRR